MSVLQRFGAAAIFTGAPVGPAMLPRIAASSIFLARHGQTAYNLERRFQGQQPVPLDDTGRAQAAELAERAADHGFAALWCSPLLRARQTADLVASRLGLEPREDARLMETDAGKWTDRLFTDVNAEAPEAFAAFLAGDAGFAFPGGESFAHQEERVAAALSDIETGPLPALVVCHGMVIRAALSSRSGHWESHAERVPNGALVPLEPGALRGGQLGARAATQPS
jgi:broad specificity phosphatase PhoE